jgi:hypothetical protein
MNINSNSGHALVNLLEHANRTGQYIAVKDGKFVLTNNKNEALKPSEIDKYAQQIFNRADNLTISQKKDLTNRIIRAHQEYAGRTQISKMVSVVENFHSFGGLPDIQFESGLPDIHFRAAEDRDQGLKKAGELPDIIPLDGLPTLKLTERLPPVQKNIQYVPTQLKMSEKNNEALLHKEEHRIKLNEKSQELTKVKTYYAKVMENSGYQDEELEGFNQSQAIKSYLNDLESYAQKFPEGKVPPKLKQAIDDLRQSYECALLASCITNGTISNEELKGILKEFSQRINNLPLSTKENAPCVILPGGFRGEEGGHSVLYKIEKTSANEVSFTIINTGGGADIIGTDGKNRLKVADIKFSGLKSEDLTPEFLTILLDKENHRGMEDAISLIKGQFPNATRSSVRERKAQINGTCAFKSTSTFIHERLGDDLHYSFKFFVTKREFQNLSRLKNSDEVKLLSQKDQNKLEDLLIRGTKVLKDRSNKLSMDYPV